MRVCQIHNNIPKNRRQSRSYFLGPASAANLCNGAQSLRPRCYGVLDLPSRIWTMAPLRLRRVVQMRAAQNHNPIAVKIELILLMRSGMGYFHICFRDVLTVYACLTILGYVIMLLSHLSPRDYGFGTPRGPPWVPEGRRPIGRGPRAPKEAQGAGQIQNHKG